MILVPIMINDGKRIISYLSWKQVTGFLGLLDCFWGSSAHSFVDHLNLSLRFLLTPNRYSWVDDTTLVVCTIPSSRGAPPRKPLTPAGPKIQANEEKLIIQNRTYQDLLKDSYDCDLFDYYATSQLVLVSLDGTTQLIGSPALYTDVDPSPDGKFLLVSSIHRPYSFIVPKGRFPKTVEVWNCDGNLVKRVCDLPLAEDIPIAFDSARKGRRSINWRSDKPASLYW
jgi:hypothetical protein